MFAKNADEFVTLYNLATEAKPKPRAPEKMFAIATGPENQLSTRSRIYFSVASANIF